MPAQVPPILDGSELHIDNARFMALVARHQQHTQADLSRGLFHSRYVAHIDEPDFGKGSFQSLFIRPGITLQLASFTPAQPMHHEVGFAESVVSLSYRLRGDTQYYIPLVNHRGTLQQGTYSFFKAPPHTGHAVVQAGILQQTVSLNFVPEAFAQLMAEALHLLPQAMQTSLSEPMGIFTSMGQISSGVRQLALSLLNNPLKGLAAQFFIEAKMLELLALHFDSYEQQQVSPALRGTDEEKIRACRSLLESRYAHPPSLLQLAQELGINQLYLKNGFRQLYGQPIYRWLLSYRMQKAQQLLRGGQHNVSQVADAIGYESLGSFSNAYLKHFGHRPAQDVAR